MAASVWAQRESERDGRVRRDKKRPHEKGEKIANRPARFKARACRQPARAVMRSSKRQTTYVRRCMVRHPHNVECACRQLLRMTLKMSREILRVRVKLRGRQRTIVLQAPCWRSSPRHVASRARRARVCVRPHVELVPAQRHGCLPQPRLWAPQRPRERRSVGHLLICLNVAESCALRRAQARPCRQPVAPLVAECAARSRVLLRVRWLR